MPDVGGNFEIPVNVPVKFEADYQALVSDLNSVSRKLTSSMSDAGRDAMKKLESELRRGEGGALRAAETVFKKLAKLASQSLGEDSPILDEITRTFEAAAGKIKGVGGADLGAGIGGRLKGQSGDDFSGVDESMRRMKANAAQLQDVFLDLQKNLKGLVEISEASFLKMGDIYQRFIGQETVGNQKKMQEDRIADRERERLHQNEMLNRRAGMAAEEEARFKRKQLIKDESKVKEAALKADNLVLNSYLQQQVVKTKESLDRRQQFQRFFLDSTRSTFRAASSAIDNIWNSTFSRLGTLFRRSEDDLTSTARRGAKNRQDIYAMEGRARGDAMTKFQQQGDKGVIGALAGTSRLGGMMRGVAMAGGGAIGLGAIFKLGSEFQEQLNVTAALTNATEKEFQALRKASIDLGNDITLPGISAGAAAEAMGMLARSGFSVRDSISAAKGVLSLARGAQIDFGQASTIVGKSLNVFGIEAKNATQVADAFSGALAQAPQSITDIQNSVARGAGAFVNMQKGVDGARNNMEKFLATSSYLIKKTGRSGEEVGTGMKRFFEVFQNPSKPAKIAIDQLSKASGLAKGAGNIMFDANGKARKFEETVGLLQKGVAGLGTEQQRASVIGQIFGSEASAIAMALADQEFSVGKAQIRIRQLGDSAKIAAARNAGLKGALDALKSQFETFAILIYEKVNKPLGNFVTGIAKLVDTVANGGGAWAILRQGLLGAAAGLAAVLAVKGVTELFGYLKIAIGAVLSPMGLLIVAATAIGAAFAVAYKTSKPFREFVETVKLQAEILFEEFQKKGIPAIVDFAKKMYALGKEALEPVGEWFKRLWERVRDFADNFGPVVAAAVALVKIAFADLVAGFNGAQIDTIFGKIGSAAKTAFTFVQNAFDSIVGAVKWAGMQIKAAFDAGGIVGAITAPFIGIKNFVVSTFKNIDWGTVTATVLGGIRTVFAAIGRRIGLIVGSNEFRNTVLVAVGVIGGILGSAAIGLIEGLLDGLRKSELGRKIGQVLKEAVNPIEIIKNIFGAFTGDGGAVATLLLTGGLLAGAMLAMKKLKDVFSTGLSGLKIGFQFATGNQKGAFDGLEAMKKKALEGTQANARLNASINTAFGDSMIGKVVANMARFREATSTAYTYVGVKALEMSEKIKKALSKIGGSSNMGQGGGFATGLVTGITAGTTKTLTAINNAASAIATRMATFKTEVTTLMQKGFGPALMEQMPSMLAGGAAAGGGLAAMIVGNDPATKFAGLVSGITGVVTAINMAKQASEVFGTALAGIATGGIMAVFAAVSFAVGIFAKRAADAKKKTEEFKAGVQALRPVFSELVERFGASGAAIKKGFGAVISASSDETARKLVDLSAKSGISLDKLAGIYSRGSKGLSEFIGKQKEELAVLVQQQQLLTAAASGTKVQSPETSKALSDIRGQVAQKREFIKVVEQGGAALKEEIRITEAKAKLDALATEQARKTSSELTKNKEATERWKGATDELASALTSMWDTASGRDTQKSLDDAATSMEGLIRLLKDGVPVADLFNGKQTQGARDARNAYDEVKAGIADVMSARVEEGLRSGASLDQINLGLGLQREALLSVAKASGLTESQFNLMFGSYFDGSNTAQMAAKAFFDANADGFKVITTKAKALQDSVDKLNITGKMKADLKAFIAEPSEKTIKTLLDNGLTLQQIQQIVDDPTQKTIEAILATGTYQSQLPPVVAPVDKPVTPVITNPTKPVGLELLKRPVDKPAVGKITNPGNPVGIGVLKSPTSKPVVAVTRLLPGWFNSATQPVTKQVNPTVSQSAIDSVNRSASSKVTKPVDIVVNNEQSFLGKIRSILTVGLFANGGVVTKPTFSVIGEGNRPEVVIPLTKPKRAVELYQQSGLAKVLASGGLGNSAQAMPSKSSNVTVNQTFNVNGDTNLRKSSRKAMAAGYDLGRQLRGI